MPGIAGPAQLGAGIRDMGGALGTMIGKIGERMIDGPLEGGYNYGEGQTEADGAALTMGRHQEAVDGIGHGISEENGSQWAYDVFV